jgi:hypothetical protein
MALCLHPAERQLDYLETILRRDTRRACDSGITTV